jgi:hypothetical protein
MTSEAIQLVNGAPDAPLWCCRCDRQFLRLVEIADARLINVLCVCQDCLAYALSLFEQENPR